jgi:hypothetical protein
MKRKLILLLAAAAVLVSGLVSLRRLARRPQPTGLPVVTNSAGPDSNVAITRSPEEIFRRAFWQRPTAADHIVHADRREWSDHDQAVQHWQWFLQVRPSAALLSTLRDPTTFGLLPGTPAHSPIKPSSAPAWFPTDPQRADCEMLQGPAGGLTVYYRAADNVLFATDAGRGFAPPVTQLARR